jgi:hypothetical protein
MTEQELTALAKNLYEAPQNQGRPHYQRDLAEGYLALLAERDTLRDMNDECRRLNSHNWEALKETRVERDALKAQLEATQKLAAAGLGRQLHMPPSEPPAAGVSNRDAQWKMPNPRQPLE